MYNVSMGTVTGDRGSPLLALLPLKELLHHCLGTFIVLVALLLSPFTATAQISLQAEVAPKTGTTDDVFKFVVTVTGSQSAPNPTLQGGDDFVVTFVGPQTSLSIINGSVDMRASYIYRLSPKRAGELTSPVAEIDTPQGKLSTPRLTVSVQDTQSSQSSQNSQAPQNSRAPLGQSQGTETISPSSPSASQEQVKNFFLDQTAIPKERVYVGQQVVNTVALYTRLQATEIRLDDLTADGFWQETLSDDQRSTVQIRGNDFSSIQILKALYPLRSGSITIPPRKVTAKVPLNNRRSPFSQFDPFSDDIFEGFFGAVEFKDVESTAPAITLEILPLPDPPEEIAPQLTSVPLVGDTAVKVDYSLDVLKIGESKSVTVQVITEGNANPVKQLPFKVPAGVKMYEERAEVAYDRSGPRLKTIKRFKYTLVPLRGGYFTVPGVKIGYFDPRTEKYKVAQSNDIAFVVQGGTQGLSQDSDGVSNDTASEGENSAGAPSLSPTNTPQQNQDLGAPSPPVYQEPTTLERIQEKMTTELILLLVASCIGVLIIVFVALQVRRPDQGSVTTPQQIHASGTIRELQDLYHNFLLAKLKVPKQGRGSSGLTVDQIRALLTNSTLTTEILHAAKALLDDFERVQYSASKADDDVETIVRLKERFHQLTQSWDV